MFRALRLSDSLGTLSWQVGIIWYWGQQRLCQMPEASWWRSYSRHDSKLKQHTGTVKRSRTKRILKMFQLAFGHSYGRTSYTLYMTRFRLRFRRFRHSFLQTILRASQLQKVGTQRLPFAATRYGLISQTASAFRTHVTCQRSKRNRKTIPMTRLDGVLVYWQYAH